MFYSEVCAYQKIICSWHAWENDFEGTEDVYKRQLQEVVESFNDRIEELREKKEKEIMTV